MKQAGASTVHTVPSFPALLRDAFEVQGSTVDQLAASR